MEGLGVGNQVPATIANLFDRGKRGLTGFPNAVLSFLCFLNEFTNSLA